MVTGNDFKLSIVLRELSVRLFNLADFPFHSCYSLRVPKRCFLELNNS